MYINYISRDNDEQSKSVYHLLTIITLLSLIANDVASAFTEDNQENGWNEIVKVNNNSVNYSKSESERIGDDDDTFNNQKTGLFVFTQYCGPGERVWKSAGGQGKFPSAATYKEIDVCCKQHDECPNYISTDSDYNRYVGLPHRQQFFSRLECSCDAKFFSCLNTLNSQYASSVAFGYGVVQTQCFDLNYPIVGCNKYSSRAGLLPLRRCLEYRVDNKKDKIWQWFDVPPSPTKLYNFPKTTTA